MIHNVPALYDMPGTAARPGSEAAKRIASCYVPFFAFNYENIYPLVIIVSSFL
jgi:hypothetical protein